MHSAARSGSALLRLAWQLPLATALILFAVLVPVYREAVQDIAIGVRSAVEEEILGLDHAYRLQGVVGLVDAIGGRVRAPRDPAAAYLLVDALGRPLAGNLAAWPSGLDAAAYPWFSVAVGADDTLDGQVFVLVGGERLLVARRSPLKAFRAHLTMRLLLAGAAAVAGCGLLAIIALGRYRRGLAQMRAKAQAILAGDLSQRLPLAGADAELDRLAAEFNEAFAEIEGLMDASRNVSSAIAHDMRRPIAAIRYRLEELAARDDLPPAALGQLEALLRQTDETLATFASLLRLARLEAGSYGPLQERVDLRALLSELLDTYGAVAAAHGMSMDVALVDAQVIGDRGLLFQALQNVVDNAIKYGGGRIAISLSSTADAARIEVRDHGPGVPTADLPRLFERFFRSDDARTAGGSGVGLALVRGIIEAHHGAVHASNAAPGLAIDILLPFEGRAAARIHARRATEA